MKFVAQTGFQEAGFTQNPIPSWIELVYSNGLRTTTSQMLDRTSVILDQIQIGQIAYKWTHMTYRSGEPSRKFVEHTVLAHHKEQNMHKK